jgi:antitoxin MazE
MSSTDSAAVGGSGNFARLSNVDTRMRTRLQKWGNSLAIRIPQPFAKETRLEENSPVDVSLRDGTLVIAPVKEPAFTLEELIAGITKRNRHDEVVTGDPSGNEAW